MRGFASEMRRTSMRAALGAAALVAMTSTSEAAPVVLANDTDVGAFASLIKEYAGATRVHWVVAARTHAAADALIAAIALRLPTEDRELMTRVKAEAFADEPDIIPKALACDSRGIPRSTSW
jgi:hypothetical protein